MISSCVQETTAGTLLACPRTPRPLRATARSRSSTRAGPCWALWALSHLSCWCAVHHMRLRNLSLYHQLLLCTVSIISSELLAWKPLSQIPMQMSSQQSIQQRQPQVMCA